MNCQVNDPWIRIHTPETVIKILCNFVELFLRDLENTALKNISANGLLVDAEGFIGPL